MNPIRIDYIRNHLAEYKGCEEAGRLQKRHKLPFEGLRILDVGSGGGLLSEVVRCSMINRVIGTYLRIDLL